MKMFRIIILVSFLAVLMGTTPTWVEAGVSPNQINKIVRDAERKMYSGKNQEALSLLQQAEAMLQQAEAGDPGNPKVKRVEKKYLSVRKKIERKLGASSKATAGHGKTASAHKSKPTKSGLPSGVKKRLRDISRHLDNVERYVEKDSGKAMYKLNSAAELFAEIDKNYGSKFDPADPAYSEVKDRYTQLLAKAETQAVAEKGAEQQATAAKEQMEKQSAEWVAKFREYLSYPGQEGHNPDTLVFIPGSSEPEKFAEAQSRFAAFKKFLAKYQSTSFPNGKTTQLEQLADSDAVQRVKNFEESFADRVSSLTGGVAKSIDEAMAYLNRDNGWSTDTSLKPNLIDHKRMASIAAGMQQLITGLGEQDQQVQAIQAKFNTLKARDAGNRQIRKERTFMIADRYTGSDIDQLKKKASSLVQKNVREGGTPLRCTIISSDWKEETVNEWTDTSKSATRWRTTRSLTAQVAAKSGAQVRLVTVALAKDRRTDGSWGELYGNLHQYSDPMLENNVFQSGP